MPIARLNGITSTRNLITIDPNTAVATFVGDRGVESFSALAFDGPGILYGSTGDNANDYDPYNLFTISTTTATPMQLCEFNVLECCPSLAFHPGENEMCFANQWR